MMLSWPIPLMARLTDVWGFDSQSFSAAIFLSLCKQEEIRIHCTLILLPFNVTSLLEDLCCDNFTQRSLT